MVNKIPKLLLVKNDPMIYGEAITSKEAAFQKEAIREEMNSIFLTSHHDC